MTYNVSNSPLLNVVNAFLRGGSLRKLNMRSINIILITSLVTFLSIGNACAVKHMPTGSFLQSPARSRQELCRELQKDKLVRKRYSRVFQATPQNVIASFKTLHLARLPQNRKFKVYYVHKGEVIGYKVRTIKRGVEVFALSNGEPVLLGVCGNPLRNKLPLVRKQVITVLPPKITLPQKTLQEALAPMMSSSLVLPPQFTGSILDHANDPSNLWSLTPAGYANSLFAPQTGLTGGSGSGGGGGGGGFPPIYSIPPGGPFGPPITPTPPVPPTPPFTPPPIVPPLFPPAVPEPGVIPMLVALGGVAGVMWRGRIRRSRS